MNRSTQIEVIQDLVRKRKTRQAQKAIKIFLKKNTNDAGLELACQFYFKLGLYLEGFKLVKEFNPLSTNRKPKLSKRQSLWSAQFLNLLGASQFALQFVNLNLKLFTEDDIHDIIAVLTSNFEYRRAIDLFQDHFSKFENEDWIRHPMRILTIADCYNAIGNSDTAIRLAKRVYLDTPVSINKGIALEATGEYLCAKGRYSESLKCLDQALTYMPTDDTSPDLAYLLKWKGYALCKTGRYKTGMRLIDKSLRHMLKQPIREEALLHVLFLKKSLKTLSRAENAKLHFFPGASSPIPENEQESERRKVGIISIGVKHAKLHISPQADEYSWNGVRYLHLPKEIKFVALLRLAGDWGVTKPKVYQALWPDEPYAYDQFEARVSQLISRIKKIYGLAIDLKNYRFYIEKTQLKAVSLHLSCDLRPSIIQNQSRFSANDIGRYFAISNAQRTKILKSWVARGWVAKVARGQYRTLPYES